MSAIVTSTTDPIPAAAPARDVISPDAQLDTLQRELNRVRDELDAMRRRDDTLRYYLQRIDEELKLAARLQQDFLPKSLPQVGPIRIQTLFRPAGHVSGDLFDVMRVDEAHVGFYIADAVGHGMPAALLTMFLKQALVTKEIGAGGYRLLSPEQTMAKLNDALCAQNLSHATFATALYGHVHSRTLRLSFARGGHPNPMLLTAAGELRELETDGSLLGIFPRETFEPATVQLAPGDRVFIYTDGVELTFSEGEVPDPSRWREELQRRGTQPTSEILRAFAEQIDLRNKSGNSKADDVAMIVVEVAPN
jgi:sigma-B regulation protein RsbU (phosphoserine phosphatase)